MMTYNYYAKYRKVPAKVRKDFSDTLFFFQKKNSL